MRKKIRPGSSRQSYQRGLYAEYCALALLRLKGYRLLARRYKTPVGEIDLVMRRGNMLVFTEVKARQSLRAAIESLNPHMRSRISRAAGFYLAAHPDQADFQMRFDLVALAPPFLWRHLDNAWQVPT